MLEALLGNFAGMVWNYPVVGLCFITGLFFTLRLGFIQIRGLKHAFQLISGHYDNPNEKGQITHFQALTAALSGTIGLGNIAGVAIAIAMGGPGSIFWLWCIGFIGMATKYAECALGTYYRIDEKESGEVRGGPMFYITRGLGEKWRPMAVFYGIAIALAGIGSASMFQANQAASALTQYNIPPIVTGLVIFSLASVVIIGGIKRIGAVASKIVPLMCTVYVLGALYICFVNIDQAFVVLQVIIEDAFSGKAAAGGAFGSVLIWGVRRAIFSNEAGLGSASIAHAAVKTDYPIREGIVASLGPMIDTLIVCSATAMVIILGGHYGNERFQALPHSLQTFSQQTEHIELGSRWTLAQDETPDQEKDLRTYTDGTSSMMISPDTDGDRTGAAVVKNISTIVHGNGSSDGVRFSYFKEAGPLVVKLLDHQDRYVGSVSLNEGTPIATGPIDAKGFVESNQWGSVVITYNDDLKGIMSEHQTHFQTVGLTFQGSPKQSHWYIDNVASVQGLTGVGLTIASFDKFIDGFGSIFITFSIVFFAFSTIITWSYYGETAADFVFGVKAIKPYKWLFLFMALMGSVMTLSSVINFSDAMLGLAVIPNAIAILLLSPKVAELSKDYFNKLRRGEIKPYK